MRAGQSVLFNVDANECPLVYLEHVVLRVNLQLRGMSRYYSYSDHLYLQNGDKAALNTLLHHGDIRRGDISISLESPYGTTSHLLPPRPKDYTNVEGFRNWPFMSVRHWGESPQGVWKVNVSYSPGTPNQGVVNLISLKLELHGTMQTPEAVQTIPSQCDEQCQGTCAGQGPFLCDVCKFKRNSVTLECVDNCSVSDVIQGSYCIPSSDHQNSTTCVTSPPEPATLGTKRLTSSPEPAQESLLSGIISIHNHFHWQINFISLFLGVIINIL